MSGGSLDYFYSRIDEPIQIISEKIKWGKKIWSLKTLRKFNMAIKYLRVAQIYSKRIEWLLSGDDGEESFHERLKDELEKFKKNYEEIEPQLKKCSLCQNFNGKDCDYRWKMTSYYFDHPEWEEMDRKDYKRRLTDASDCYDFEEIRDEDF
jgi:hypothetical protein